MESVDYVQDLTLPSDCLGQVSILSQFFEGPKCDIPIAADRNIQWTINALHLINENVHKGMFKFDLLLPKDKMEFTDVQLVENQLV